jgi:hypothetical protein
MLFSRWWPDYTIKQHPSPRSETNTKPNLLSRLSLTFVSFCFSCTFFFTELLFAIFPPLITVIQNHDKEPCAALSKVSTSSYHPFLVNAPSVCSYSSRSNGFPGGGGGEFRGADCAQNSQTGYTFKLVKKTRNRGYIWTLN